MCSERVRPVTAETARLAIETLMRLVGEANGVVIETTILGVKDDEETQKKAEALG